MSDKKIISATFFTLAMFILPAYSLYAKGYKITVRLSNSKDTVLLLAHYYSDKQYLDDTAYVDKQGLFQFKGDSLLHEGMYIVAGQSKTRYFDFFATGGQQIGFECDPNNVTTTMKVKGSEENSLFYEYIRFLAGKQKEIEPYTSELKKHSANADSVKLIRNQIAPIDKAVKDYMEGIFTKYPSLLAFKFIKANNEIDLTPFIIGNNGKTDSTLMYPMYKKHFFDNLDFKDPRLIWTPVWASKVNLYFDKVCNPNPDSMKREIDHFFQMTSDNPQTQKFAAWFLSLKFESSQILGYDALFVYIVRNYLENNRIEWQYPSVKKNVIDRVSVLEPLLLSKPAPNMIMLDTNNLARSLQNIKTKYTLVFFWESTCGHCQHEMPNVVKFYNEFHKKYNLEIYGVSSDTSLTKWKDFIRKNNMTWINVNGNLTVTQDFHKLYDIHSTPVMYLLDENKKILAKLLLSDGMGDFIKRTEELKTKQNETEKK
jgi:peroxiredoxin